MTSTTLRDQLIEQTTPDPRRKAHFDAAMQELLSPKLSPLRQRLTQVSGVVALILTLPMGLLFLQESGPIWMRLGLLLCTLAPLNMGIYMLSLARSRRYHRRVYGLWQVAHLTAFAWVFTGLVLMKALAAPDPAAMIPLLAFAGLMAVGLGVVPLVLWRIKRSELAIREQLLRSELAAASSPPEQ
ncbi:MAG: hypothetical protein RLY93_16035 [Sumerlaeia bacterium]